MSSIRINQASLDKKQKKLESFIEEKLEDTLVNIGTYAVQISPVYSGAFAESWSIRPIGSGGGRSRQSRDERVPDVQAKKEEAKGNIRSDVATYSKQILENGGAELNNRAPHAKEVDAKYATIATVRDKFR